MLRTREWGLPAICYRCYWQSFGYAAHVLISSLQATVQAKAYFVAHPPVTERLKALSAQLDFCDSRLRAGFESFFGMYTPDLMQPCMGDDNCRTHMTHYGLRNDPNQGRREPLQAPSTIFDDRRYLTPVLNLNLT